MNNFILLYPQLESEDWLPNLGKKFSIIFDTEISNWKVKLNMILRREFLLECKLFCLYGSNAREAEDIVDEWLIDQQKNSLFFPTISDDDMDEIFYTINTNFIILITRRSEVYQLLFEAYP